MILLLKFFFIDKNQIKSFSYNQLDQSMMIICKRLKLKSEIEDNSNKYGKITSKFFLPGFLPVFASIPDPFIKVFEDDYINMRENTFGLVKGSLIVNPQLLAKDLKQGVLSNNNFEYLKQTLSFIPKAFEVIVKESSA